MRRLAPAADRRRVAFSLLEVVVAVAIFAVGMVAIVALFAPIARSVTDTADTDRAARVADALRLKLRTMPIADVVALFKEAGAGGHELTAADARSDYDLSRDPDLLFANRDGTKIGPYNDPVWIDPVTRRNSDREKFFEIALVRDETLSPAPYDTVDSTGATVRVDPGATAPFLAYTARLRWPAYIGDGTATGTIQFGANPAGSVRFDHSRKQVLHISGTIAR